MGIQQIEMNQQGSLNNLSVKQIEDMVVSNEEKIKDLNHEKANPVA
jgi:hypothetical protein